MQMGSRFELNLPDSMAPMKQEGCEESVRSSSPLLQSSGDMASMINTGGTPIASLKTPTKVLVCQNSANKHPIALTPTRLYIKAQQDMGGYSAASSAVSLTSNSQAAPHLQLTGNVSSASVYQSLVANNKPLYARIAASQGGDSVSTPSNRQVRPIATNTAVNINHQQLSTHIQPEPAQSVVNRQMNNSNIGAQRVLLPACNSQTLRISSSQSLAQIKSQLPPGTTILSSSDASGQMLAFLPTSHAVIHQTAPVKQLCQGNGQTLLRDCNPPALDSAPPPIGNNSQSAPLPGNMTSNSSDANKQKKPCNCTKSQCLKLYCDCFANGEFCANCNCQNCYNNLDHEEERQKAVKQCLERNPHAFHPKIGKSAKADSRRHQKGCNCKRSGCLKNYCECYEAKIPCGSMCKCVGCKNCEGHEMKGLMQLADAADLKHSQLSHFSQDLTSFMHETMAPHTYLKKAVIEAIIDCLIAQCREAEIAKCKDSTTEKVILEEYGRCLSEVIKASNQTRR